MAGSESEREEWRQAMALYEQLRDLAPELHQEVLDAQDPRPGVRDKLRALWRGRDTPDDLLDAEPGRLLTQVGGNRASAIRGMRLGPYELLEEIGRGGMSVVFRARRADGQFEREVAVKILTLAQLASGSETKLRHEQAVLARLNHAGIATLLDGGMASDGTPWLAMELVDGRPVDEYCDEAGLDPRRIVTLILQVCNAVSYAHQNLIVHRDLKPGNIFVESNGRVRVLDFGIAKLLNEAGDEDTSTRILTPEYGAPEQRSGAGVTTATDVYGLGAVLHRLLTGRPPQDEGGAASGDGGRQLDRELKLILAMALRPEPERRYPTAAALGADLERWLAREPVMAAPDSLAYRTRKFLQRRRGAITAAAVVILALSAGLGGTLWQAEQARRQAQLAQAQSDFLLGLFERADVMRSGGADPSISSLLDEASTRAIQSLAGQARLQASLLRVIGVAQRELGRLAASRASLERALEAANQAGDRREAALITRALGIQAYEEGDIERGIEGLDRSVQELEGLTDDVDAILIRTRLDYANLLVEIGRPDEALAQLDQLPEILSASDDLRELFEESIRSRGMALDELGETDRALSHLSRAVSLHRAHAGDRDPSLAAFLNDYGLALLRERRLEDAEAAFGESLGILEALFGLAHPRTLATLNNMAYLKRQQGHYEVAAEVARRAVEGNRQFYGPDHLYTGQAQVMLASVLGAADHAQEALEAMEGGLRIIADRDPGSLAHGNTLSLYAEALSRVGRHQEAAKAAARAQPMLADFMGANHFRASLNRVRWAHALVSQGSAREGLDRLADARARLEADFGPTDPLVIKARLVEAEGLYQSGRMEAARTEAAALRREATEPGHASRIDQLCAQVACDRD